jgi:hypothetical protein
MAGTLDAAGALDPAGDITGATVTASDGVNSVTAPATGDFGGTAQNAWTATFTRAQLDALGDGTITVSAAFAAGANTLGGKTLTLAKDVVAPALGVDLAPGTYTGARSVTLSAGAGEQISYRTDGLPLSDNNTPYGGPIALGVGTTTLSVRVKDAAGNITDRVLTYTINAPAAGATPLATSRPPASTSRLVATGSRSLRARLRTVRRSGLAARFRVSRGARVAVARLYRLRGSRRTRVATRSLAVRTGRVRTVRFPGRRLSTGRYLIQVRVGTSRARLGRALNIRVQIVR